MPWKAEGLDREVGGNRLLSLRLVQKNVPGGIDWAAPPFLSDWRWVVPLFSSAVRQNVCQKEPPIS